MSYLFVFIFWFELGKQDSFYIENYILNVSVSQRPDLKMMLL